MNKAYFLLITGPTAVGKTDIVLKVAEQIPAEIINADMGQLYAPLTIGTAKPDWRNHPIQHHLFDILQHPKNYTVTEFRARVIELVHQILNRKKLPIIVGGSGFYIKSLFFPPIVGNEISDPIFDEANLWQKLNEIDPERAARIHTNDTYRLKRALALWHQTGKKPSSFVPLFQPFASFDCIILTRSMDDLYQRINERVITMINDGWIEEVQKLQNTEWEMFLNDKKIIGYDIILQYLRQQKDRDAMISEIQKKTRNYAKRQMTFFRLLERQLQQALHEQSDELVEIEGNVESINLTLLELDLYIRGLIEKLALSKRLPRILP